MRVNTELKEVKDIGKIPVDWEVKELKEVCEVLDSKRKPIKQEARVKGNIPYYGATGIIDFINDYIFDEEIILVGEDGENLVSRVLPMAFKVDGKAWVNNHAHVIKPYDDSVDYITYYLDKIDYSLYITGTAQPKLNQEKLSSIKILIPKLKEQEKISQILSNIDMNIKKTEQAIAKYKQVKKGLMDDLLTGKVRIKDGKRFRETNFKNIKGVGEIPWDWEVKTLVDICAQIKDGTHGTHKDVANGIPLLSAKDIKNGKVNIPRDCRRISECDYDAIHKNYKLQKNDLLITIVGTIGRMAIIENGSERFTFQRSVGIMRLKNEDFYKYIYYYMNLEKYQRQLEKLVNASVQGGIYLGSLGGTYIAKPLLNEQKDIANVLSSQDYRIKKEEEYLEKLKKLKSGLMEDLLTGKVRVDID